MASDTGASGSLLLLLLITYLQALRAKSSADIQKDPLTTEILTTTHSHPIMIHATGSRVKAEQCLIASETRHTQRFHWGEGLFEMLVSKEKLQELLLTTDQKSPFKQSSAVHT